MFFQASVDNIFIMPRPKGNLGLQDYQSIEPDLKQSIGEELDQFSQENGLQSLRDRLNIGLNGVGILAHKETGEMVQELCERVSSKSEMAAVYQEVLDMCVDIQRFGPWDYVQELSRSDTSAAKVWFMLAFAEVNGYEKGMQLNDAEFKQDLERIKNNLKAAISDPGKKYDEAKERLLKKARERVRFDESDKDKKAPMGDGFESFISMATMGYEAGVCQDADGWVFVGARGEIPDNLIESCDLEARKEKDDRDPNRTLTFYYNRDGDKVAKKVHPGLLVILTRNFEVARSIAEAVNCQREVVKVAGDALSHTRVIQTSEKKNIEAGVKEIEDKLFLRMPSNVDKSSDKKGAALSRPKETFYDRMHLVRGLYVYLDALDSLTRKKAKTGGVVTETDKDQLIANVWEKMGQKVDELRHVISLIDKDLEGLPINVNAVIDMAGGAGDLGLAVATAMLAQGRDMKRAEIVDPQPGVDKFMESIITYLPFRKKMEEIAVHNNGYLQTAEITPDSIVVAKHACGTLTDDTIELWVNSDSPYLCAMTCCQDKAADNPARYGLSQADWHRLCLESGGTNIKDEEIPSAPGKKRESMLKKREMGKNAMYKLDMARVNYLRRMGFAAELHVTDKFPKGDVIIARRLPPNFNEMENKMKVMEKRDPNKFDAVMLYIDKMINNRTINDKATANEFGENWRRKDFEELRRRMEEKKKPIEKEMDTKTAKVDGTEPKNREKVNSEKELIKSVFPDFVGGRIDVYVESHASQAGVILRKQEVGKIAGEIKREILNNSKSSPGEIRSKIDNIVAKLLKEYLK